MRFIKLTTSDSKTPFWVNPEQITAMYVKQDSTESYTMMHYRCSAGPWPVSESPEEIMRLAQTATDILPPLKGKKVRG